ncbi:uncharacterized protein I303_106882 [Kwoniella dejecticola CBS 10117]|uniref:Methyltransferase domain-containing protein n=1 Tax=Kwoniella dejecticola CBS 10117 TaxID=1296121 RepID=A0AAJ8KTL9_9TREE
MTERAPFDKGRSGERTYNDEQDRYILPADHQEVERLDTQHKAVTMLFDGLLPPEMLRTISQSNHSTNAEVNVLDVGCGTGQWLIDLAREYPRIHGVGVSSICTSHICSELGFPIEAEAGRKIREPGLSS